MKYALVLLVGLIGAVGRGEIVTKSVEYTHGATPLSGAAVYESTASGKRPGVLLLHELGTSAPVIRAKAKQLAEFGYLVFVADLFGKSPPTDASAALKLGGKDRTFVRERVAAAHAAFEKLPQVDVKRLAVVGVGVGGTAALEFARGKGDVEGVVCIHGDVTPAGDDGKSVGASVLVIVGADDPKITPNQLRVFEDEMRRGGVDWQLVRMGGVGGDFTNPNAGRNLKTGRAYDPDADKRATSLIRLFLAEQLQSAPSSAKPPVAKPPAPKAVPEKALKVLEYIDKNNEAMTGYEGGRTFGNFERRLPQSTSSGQRIKYREWDVNPLRPGVNRGAERLVTGSDGSAHYTDDHYASFKKIR